MTTRLVEAGRINDLSRPEIRAMFMAEYPFLVTVKGGFPELKEISDWCREQYGPSARVVHNPVFLYTGNHWANYARHYFFKDPDHAVMFRMVWG